MIVTRWPQKARRISFRHKHLLFSVVVVIVAIAIWRATDAAAQSQPDSQQIWVALPRTADYIKATASDAEWPITLKHISVFDLQAEIALTTTDRFLQRIFALLRSRGIPLAIEMGVQTPGPNLCGLGIEGYKLPGTIARLAERLRRLGAPLRYIAMDEPLWFGHFSTDRGRRGQFVPCRATIPQVASNVARTISAIRTQFPNVIVGDEVPLLPYTAPDLPRDFWRQMDQWVGEFQKATGRPLGFMHFDVGWHPTGSAATDRENHQHWVSELRYALAFAKAKGIRSGIFYNGDRSDQSGEVWNAHAAARFQEVEGRLGLRFGDIVFQSWMKQPRRILPESSAGAFTNLIVRYLRFRNQIK